MTTKASTATPTASTSAALLVVAKHLADILAPPTDFQRLVTLVGIKDISGSTTMLATDVLRDASRDDVFGVANASWQLPLRL
jgi:hypothetical protein